MEGFGLLMAASPHFGVNLKRQGMWFTVVWQCAVEVWQSFQVLPNGEKLFLIAGPVLMSSQSVFLSNGALRERYWNYRGTPARANVGFKRSAKFHPRNDSLYSVWHITPRSEALIGFGRIADCISPPLGNCTWCLTTGSTPHLRGS